MIRRRPGEDSNTPASAVNMAASESRRFSKPARSLGNCHPYRAASNQRTQTMAKHARVTPEEAADRLAIRELIEAYAHCADRRDAKGQMALFTPDTHFVVYMDAKDPTASQELHS